MIAGRGARLCSHAWIDPRDAPIARAPYSPVIGPERRAMKYATRYVCNNCGAVLVTPAAPSGFEPDGGEDDADDEATD
jgi:hypothetical protein